MLVVKLIKSKRYLSLVQERLISGLTGPIAQKARLASYFPYSCHWVKSKKVPPVIGFCTCMIYWECNIVFAVVASTRAYLLWKFLANQLMSCLISEGAPEQSSRAYEMAIAALRPWSIAPNSSPWAKLSHTLRTPSMVALLLTAHSLMSDILFKYTVSFKKLPIRSLIWSSDGADGAS